MRSRRLISIDLTLLLIEILDFRQADRTWGVLQGEEQGDSTDERDGGRNGETELPRRIAVMVQQKSADDTDKTRTDRVGRIDCLVASSDGLIQCAMRLMHGGTPIPWK